MLLRGWVWARSGLIWNSGSGSALGTQVAVRHRTSAPGNANDSRLDELFDAVRLQDVQERVDLRTLARRFDHDGVGGHVDDVGTEQLDDLQHLRADRRFGAHLDQ